MLTNGSYSIFVFALLLVTLVFQGSANGAPPSWSKGGGNGKAVGHGKRMKTPPGRNSDSADYIAAGMIQRAISNLGCENAGDALRRLSNEMLSPNPKLRGHFNNKKFWKRLWDRLAETYRDCELTCFDDGVAIGQISGTGYCAASIGVGGLDRPGLSYQPPLPLCENSIFIGCQAGYREAISEAEGCVEYTEGNFERIYNEYQSQDCHIDSGQF